MKTVDNLTAEQKKLLVKKLLERNRQDASSVIPARTEKRNEFLLSIAQKRIWFLEQLHGPHAAYNIPCAVKLKGILDIVHLEKSLQKIMNRHEILRTRFVIIDGTPCQQILDHCIFHLSLADPISDLTTAIHDEIQRPFHIATAPLMRGKLLKLSEKEHVLILTIHHLIADGWSFNVLLKELCWFYNGFVTGKETALQNLPFQYADYSEWQAQHFKGQGIAAQLDYWRTCLQDPPQLLKLPTDRVRPAIQDYSGDSVDFVIEKNWVEQLLNSCRNFQVTPYMFLLTAFNILLFRYSEQDDIIVGTSIANRSRSDIEPLIGFFVNNLALRTKINPDQSCLELLQSIKQTTLGAFDHSDIPFDALVEVIQPERNLSYTPLFQVEFVLQNTPRLDFSLIHLEAEVIRIASQISRFDLNISLDENDDGIRGICEYSRALFDRDTIQRFVDHFLILIKEMLHQITTPVNQINILSEREKQQLLLDWNKTEKPYPLDQPAHIIFSIKASQNLEKIAVVHRGETVTFRQLDQQSNQLANFLLKQGVKKGDRIVLCLDRGIRYVVALLAVLKAGAAFIPMDPNSAALRNETIFKHCRPGLVLTELSYSLICDAPVVHLQTIEFHLYSSEPLPNTVSMHDLAYLIYTSGSTGQPKGVMIHHLGMVNHLLAKNYDLQISDEDIVGQNAVQTFDVSIWQLLSPLLAGASVVILTGDEAWEPKALLQSIMQEKITILESVPSHTDIILDEIAENPGTYTLNHWRYYVTNAEPLPSAQWRRWVTLLPNVTMVNTYGTTECSDDTSHFHLNPSLTFNTPYVPVRGVLPYMKLYILDSQLNPVPLGVTGEVYVGGVGVGLGYFDDTERTEQAFISDPFTPHTRLYRTGDLARYHPNGDTEFLGRKDFQIKIRGLRVELGEVEGVLRSHPQIATLILTPWKQQEKNVLVCYLVSHAHPAPTEAELYQFCDERLPNYMIPSHFIFLDELPLLSNGKIDRSRLPAPTNQSNRLLNNYIPPSNELEAKLVQLWQEILGVEQVGVEDNFFHLGGHSLVAVELVRKMEKLLDRELSLQKLFEHPTIRGVIQT